MWCVLVCGVFVYGVFVCVMCMFVSVCMLSMHWCVLHVWCVCVYLYIFVSMLELDFVLVPEDKVRMRPSLSQIHYKLINKQL